MLPTEAERVQAGAAQLSNPSSFVGDLGMAIQVLWWVKPVAQSTAQYSDVGRAYPICAALTRRLATTARRQQRNSTRRNDQDVLTGGPVNLRDRRPRLSHNSYRSERT